MSCHIIWDFLHKLFENEANNKNEALLSFYHSLIMTVINPYYMTTNKMFFLYQRDFLCELSQRMQENVCMSVYAQTP